MLLFYLSPQGCSINFLVEKVSSMLQSSYKRELLFPTETIYPDQPEADHFLPLLNNIIMKKILHNVYAWWLAWHIQNIECATILHFDLSVDWVF